MALGWAVARIGVRSLMAVAVLAACEPESTTVAAPPTSLIDTVGGVPRVTNPPAPPESWTLEPVLTLGKLGMDGTPEPDAFGRVVSITADPFGDIYVADALAREIRVFDSEGVHRHTFGRAGEGPGEFASLFSVAWVADTVYVLDPLNARIHMFGGAGTLIGSMPYVPLAGPIWEYRFFPAGDARIHVRGIPPRVEAGGLVRGRKYLTYAGGVLVDSVFVPNAEEDEGTSMICESSTGVAGTSSPLKRRDILVPAGGGLVWHAQTDRYALSLVDAAGDTVRQIRRPGADRPVSDEVWAAVEDTVDAFKERVTGAVCVPSSFPRPEWAPVLADIHHTAEGLVVVEAETGTEDLYTFDFHDSEGRLVGSVPAPSRDRDVVPHFRGDLIYVATRGELDVPGVAVYRIVR